jgi:hypothetical protein
VVGELVEPQAAGVWTIQNNLAQRGYRIRRHDQRAEDPTLPDKQNEAGRSSKKPAKRSSACRRGFFFCFFGALATLPTGFQPEFRLLKNSFLQWSHLWFTKIFFLLF